MNGIDMTEVELGGGIGNFWLLHLAKTSDRSTTSEDFYSL